MPLEAGNRVELPVQASGPQGSYRFLLSVEVEARESLSVPAGQFDTVRIHHTLMLQDQPIKLGLDTRTWLEVTQGIALKTETRIITEQGEQVLSFAAQEIRQP